MSILREQLVSAINKASAEGGSNTPDFVLATYLMECLGAFDRATKQRDDWYGVNLFPGCKTANDAPAGKLREQLGEAVRAAAYAGASMKTLRGMVNGAFPGMDMAEKVDAFLREVMPSGAQGG